MAQERLDVYLSKAEKSELLKISKKTGMSMSKLLLKGFSYWLSHNPKGLEEEAEIFKGLMEEREAKRMETDLGDYIHSFEKLDGKLDYYKQLRDEGKITEQEYEAYVKQTKKNYEVTQRVKRKRFGTSTREDKFEEFLAKKRKELKKKGYKVTKDGIKKIRKA